MTRSRWGFGFINFERPGVGSATVLDAGGELAGEELPWHAVPPGGERLPRAGAWRHDAYREGNRQRVAVEGVGIQGEAPRAGGLGHDRHTVIPAAPRRVA